MNDTGAGTCPAAPGPNIVTPSLVLPSPTARLGTDGRFHLTGNVRADSVCAPPTTDAHQHSQRCNWWSDGSDYRVNPKPIPPGDDWTGWCGVDFVNWGFTLTGAPVPAESVPRRHRCNVSGRYAWPVFHDLRTIEGMIRHSLFEELGPWCHICGRQQTPLLIDHNHTNGQVRGLLCGSCNAWVDRCSHEPPGCAFAEYRHLPPAAPSHLMYPSWNSRRPRPARCTDLSG